MNIELNNVLLAPNLGLIIWQTLVLLILIWLLAKYAWKPILKAVKDREDSIDKALKSAEEAKAEMATLKSSNEDALKQAKEERDAILKEAREMKEKIVAEAKVKANEESDRIVANAREVIKNEKNAAVAELKNQVAALSIEIAEKIVKKELSSDDKQKALADTLVDDMNLN